MLAPKFVQHAGALPPVAPEEVERYERYFALLLEWNEKINLVSRKSIETSFAYHYADSLFLSDIAKSALGGRVFRDLGSGAGFPGLVFAIRYPQARVALYEKLAKRRAFLLEVVRALELERVAVEPGLTEGRFKDLFTARAVLPPLKLLAFMKERLLPGGRLVVSLGGSNVLETVPKGFSCLERKRYSLPEGAGERQALVLERVPRETKR